MYRAGQTQTEIAHTFGLTQTTVGANLRRWGCKTRRVGPKRRLTVSEDYFSKIDTEEKAYWLGFLFADGSIRQSSKGQWTCRLELATKDADHIRKFLEAISGVQTIADGHHGASKYAVISSVTFCKHLETQGCIRNKTKNGIKFPDLPDDLLRHFIRGFFDGDGWLSGTNSQATFGVVSADRRFLLKIQDWLICKLGLNQTKLIEKETTWSLQYCGNTQVAKIAELLYDNCTVALDRKKQIAVSLYSNTL